MKILVISDIHGIDTWKYQVNEALHESDTMIIFLGDYVDSFTISSNAIIQNLYDIIAIKKAYPNRIVLLLGNHDYAYIFGKVNMSGFNYAQWHQYRNIFNKNWNLFQAAWGHQGNDKYTLFTHAGLTDVFFKNVIKEIEDPDSILNDILVKESNVDWKTLKLHEILNYLIDSSHLMWQIGFKRKGDYLSGSILWADKTELIKYAYPNIDQVVGHTNQYYFEIKFIGNDKIYFTDVHDDLAVIGFMLELK